MYFIEGGELQNDANVLEIDIDVITMESSKTTLYRIFTAVKAKSENIKIIYNSKKAYLAEAYHTVRQKSTMHIISNYIKYRGCT